MRQSARYTKPESSPLIHPIRHRWREGLFVFSVVLSLLLLLALFTYANTSSIAALPVDTNISGKVGALFAQGMLYLFGYVAYFIPIVIPYGVWLLTKAPSEEEFHYDTIVWRGLGFLLALISSCGLAALQYPHVYQQVPYSGGGIFGTAVALGLVATFSLIGTTILLFGLFLCGITLFSGLSWVGLSNALGQVTIGIFTWALGWLEGKREGRTLKRHQRDAQAFTKIVDEESEAEEEEEPLSVNKRQRRSRIEFPTAIRLDPVILDLSGVEKNNTVSQRAPIRSKSIALKTHINNRSIKHGLPSLELLDLPEAPSTRNYSPQTLEAMSREVELRLKDFGVIVQVVAAHPGPVVTRFEMQLAPGIKVSRISTLAKDLARSLSVISVRVVEVIPGKSVVGLELPNQHREIVRLSEVLSSPQYDQARSPLSLALGKDIAGNPVVVDLAKMPHLLVAGTTGSGKSVGLNAMLLSFLFKSTPEEVRMIMIDPKMLELSIYEGIPHLLAPVVTDMKDAANALRWCVAEMDRRYRLMAALGVRNLAGYNAKIIEAETQNEPLLDPLWRPQLPDGSEEPAVLSTLPYIVVIVDEFADLFMVVGKKIEELIARIAQKARAAGIHLILATQRPSVDVITGLIKANIPTRIAFQVSSKIDSRTILDQQGAEQLLGHGDMLYLAPGTGVPIRVHGAFVADQEVHKVVEDWRQRGTPDYIDGLCDEENGISGLLGEDGAIEEDAETDPLYDQAVQIVVETRRASISGVQRRLKIGYNRAARLLEAMEKAGLVSPMESNGSREVLVPETLD
jgi:S-DNA-T family DNA segregation ATPase FtsK/SpoIIIE